MTRLPWIVSGVLIAGCGGPALFVDEGGGAVVSRLPEAPGPPAPDPVAPERLEVLLARWPASSAGHGRALRLAFEDAPPELDQAERTLRRAVEVLPAHGLTAAGYHLHGLDRADAAERAFLLARAALLLRRDLRPGDDADTAVQLRFLADVARDPEGAVGGLAPRVADYGTLLAALARYRALSWPALEVPRRLHPKALRAHPFVRDLRRRLAAEGFPSGDPEAAGADRIDAGLAAALREWQETRGIPATGRPDPQTLAALAVPATELVRRIAESLAAWRRSAARDGDGVLRVNVPAFEATLYVDGRPDRVHRVVVGGRSSENRTPVLLGAIDRVVLNPV